MDRRFLVFSLAAAGLAGPALAQTAATRPAGAAPAAGMGPAEMDHAKKTAAVGMLSLQTSDIALGKASNAKVKEFAQFEHDEQTTIAEILKSMDPSTASMQPDDKGMAMISKLKEAKAGAAFDRDYVAGQIEGHQMLLAIQEDYLKAGKDMHHMAVVKLARGMIKEHLVLLGDLKKAIG